MTVLYLPVGGLHRFLASSVKVERSDTSAVFPCKCILIGDIPSIVLIDGIILFDRSLPAISFRLFISEVNLPNSVVFHMSFRGVFLKERRVGSFARHFACRVEPLMADGRFANYHTHKMITTKSEHYVKV